MHDALANHREIAGARPEPQFEPPPQMAQRAERRLTARAVARFAAGLGASEFRDNIVRLRLSHGTTEIVAVGAAVARTFALVPGPCRPGPEPDDLAACLRDACDILRVCPGVVPFEAAVQTPGAACVLLRGVLLPQSDGSAEAVLSWKQVLDDDATALLRAELMRSLQRGRKARGGCHSVDVFA